MAVDPQCPFDLIAVDEEGNCRKYDVKTISHRKNINLRVIKNTLRLIES